MAGLHPATFQLGERRLFARGQVGREGGGIDDLGFRAIGKFLQGRFRLQLASGHRSAFFAQLLLQRALLFRDLLLADLELLFQIRLPHSATKKPEPERDKSTPEREDALPNEMNRAQPGHQNEAGQVDAAEDDDRPLAPWRNERCAGQRNNRPSRPVPGF